MRRFVMEKVVIVINGSGGVGKDTVCDIVGKYYRTMNISSIDPIKKIATENGWNGEKDEKSRKFLADLKQLFVDFNDLPQKYLMEKYRDFMQSDDEILFVHIREPKEIDKFKGGIGGKCVTLLVRGRDDVKKEWNNRADDEVENYRYDYVYENVMGLAEIDEDLLPFVREIVG
jgi:hypothetical protein